MLSNSRLLSFRIDPLLPQNLRRSLDAALFHFQGSTIEELKGWQYEAQGQLTVDFISESSLHLLKQGGSFKICILDRNQGLFSFGENLDSSHIDAILDDSFDVRQLETLIAPRLRTIQQKTEENLFQIGLKNLRKLEAVSKAATNKTLEDGAHPSSESLLDYAQALVDLEKNMIHSDDLSKMEKTLKVFAKTHLEKSKFQFYHTADLGSIASSKNLLSLPRFKGEFVAIEMSWEDEDYFRLFKKTFFYYTLVAFYSSQREIQDPFVDESLWESVLDGIPFPVALLSTKAEVYQHNSLFAKLNFAPIDCLKLKLREKIQINDIPYNIFKKEIFHLGEAKILFVFFTESFFLKGDGNITPSGQELGIISSSIAHELNNPIAGIQAALTLLMLDEALSEEASQTLQEMKNGATRCKQLIETFLGFSRATPRDLRSNDLQISPIEICYQQAQNLLRFRTVESGIRFQFAYSKHTDFRAQVNLSLLTMTFYLIFGEIMTLYSHQLLVANKNQVEKGIKGEIIESSQEIQIQLHELNISSLNFSKLIQNLLTIENFVLQVSDYSLRFIYNP